MKKRCYILIFVAVLVFLFAAQGTANQREGGKNKYKEALKFVEEGQYEFALMEFRAIIRDFPESRYAQESLFAIGEYFYSQNAHYEAVKDFAAYIRTYLESDGAVFARAYLLRIIQGIDQSEEENREALEDIEMEFFSQPLFLLFSEYKEVSYKSGLQNDFRIRYYIDMIEVYRNDELFIKITQ